MVVKLKTKRGRPKVDRIRVNLKLSPKLYRQLRKAAKAEGLTGSAFVELSVAERLERLRR
jgi:uncharacterized protein (DUF1778 family)